MVVLQPGPETLSRSVPTDSKLAGAISFSVSRGLHRTRITSFLFKSSSSVAATLYPPRRYSFPSSGVRTRRVLPPIKSILSLAFFRNRSLIPSESNVRDVCADGTRGDWREHVSPTPTAQEFRRRPLSRCVSFDSLRTKCIRPSVPVRLQYIFPVANRSPSTISVRWKQ